MSVLLSGSVKIIARNNNKSGLNVISTNHAEEFNYFREKMSLSQKFLC